MKKKIGSWKDSHKIQDQDLLHGANRFEPGNKELQMHTIHTRYTRYTLDTHYSIAQDQENSIISQFIGSGPARWVYLLTHDLPLPVYYVL